MSEKKDVLNYNEEIKENNFENKSKIIFSIENNLEKKESKKEEKKNIFLTKKTFHYISKKISDNSKKKSNNIIKNKGRWSKDEHDKFLEGIQLYGMDWRSVKKFIDTRTLIQVRSHAQKFYLRMKLCKDENLGINFTLNSICNLKDMINQIKSISGNYNIKNVFNLLYKKYKDNEKSNKKGIQNIKNKSLKNGKKENIINLQENNYYINSNLIQNNEINSIENFEKNLTFNKNIQNYNQAVQNNNLLLNNRSYFELNNQANNNYFNNNFINNMFLNNNNFYNLGNSLIKDFNFINSYNLLPNNLNYYSNNTDKNILINYLLNQNYNIPYYNSLPIFDELLKLLIINNNNFIKMADNFYNFNNSNNNNYINQINDLYNVYIKNNIPNINNRNISFNFELNKNENNNNTSSKFNNIKESNIIKFNNNSL